MIFYLVWLAMYPMFTYDSNMCAMYTLMAGILCIQCLHMTVKCIQCLLMTVNTNVANYESNVYLWLTVLWIKMFTYEHTKLSYFKLFSSSNNSPIILMTNFYLVFNKSCSILFFKCLFRNLQVVWSRCVFCHESKPQCSHTHILMYNTHIIIYNTNFLKYNTHILMYNTRI